MAQLKDLIVNGASQLIGDVYTSQIQISKLNASTTAGGATYGAGSAGQVLTSNGTNTYWGVELNNYYGSLATNGWKNLGGRTSGAKLTVAYNNASATWNVATYSASLLFGNNDTRGFLDIAHASPVVGFAGGSVGGTTDNDPKWYYKLSGTSGCTYTFPTATKTLAANDGSNATGTWTLNLKTNKVQAPTAAGGSTYGAGSAGQALLSNGTTVYWGDVASSFNYGETLPTTAAEGDIFFQLSSSANGAVVATKLVTTAATASTNYYLVGATVAGEASPYIATANANGSSNTAGVYFNGSTGVLSGAAWNDYAEFREPRNIDISDIPYGRCVIENGDDTVSFSTKRLQPCGQIVSDTYGFTLGTESGNLPIALCGRVLAYTYESRKEFKVGDAVCTGPDGMVSKMTREEIKEYPDRIVGYVASIPNYLYWGEANIEVKGRIWIKVK